MLCLSMLLYFFKFALIRACASVFVGVCFMFAYICLGMLLILLSHMLSTDILFVYVYYILLVLRACTCPQLGKLFYPVYRNYWMGLHLDGSLIYHKWMHVLPPL